MGIQIVRVRVARSLRFIPPTNGKFTKKVALPQIDISSQMMFLISSPNYGEVVYFLTLQLTTNKIIRNGQGILALLMNYMVSLPIL